LTNLEPNSRNTSIKEHNENMATSKKNSSKKGSRKSRLTVATSKQKKNLAQQVKAKLKKTPQKPVQQKNHLNKKKNIAAKSLKKIKDGNKDTSSNGNLKLRGVLKSEKTKVEVTKKTSRFPKNNFPKEVKKAVAADKSIKKIKFALKEDPFSLETFVTEQMGSQNEKAKNLTISDSGHSSLFDLILFNTSLVHAFYKVTDLDTLEATAFALKPKDKVDSSNPAFKEVALYKDLLLLGDLPTITQEKRIYEWIISASNLSTSSMVAIISSFITLAMKMTGNKPARYYSRVPGGKLVKKKEEVTSYLAIMHTIVNAMDKAKMKKVANLERMKDDLVKIINDA